MISTFRCLRELAVIANYSGHYVPANWLQFFSFKIEIKMAAMRAHMAVDYNQLNSFSSVVLYDITHTSTRKTYKNKLNVKCIIYRRKTRNVSIEVNTWCHLHVETCYKSVFISSLQRIMSILLSGRVGLSTNVPGNPRSI